MKSMAKTLSIGLVLMALSFSMTNAASSCYSCSNCGTTWDSSKASIIQTSSATDYCRKTVTGTLVSKDSTSSCTDANVLGNGVFCCQTDLCNSANKQSITMMQLGFLTALIYTMYHHMY